LKKNHFQKVKEYWENQETVSLKDESLKKLEIDTIIKLIKANKTPLIRDLTIEIGCGDGEGAKNYHQHSKHHICLDYSLTMLKKGKQSLEDKTNISFIQADVRDLPFKESVLFDLIISERCLINLPSVEQQYKSINQLTNHLKSKGQFIFVEGTKQGLDNLNKIRGELSLSPIPMPWHNIFFNEDELIPVLNKNFAIRDKNSFWFYYIGSRILNPAVEHPNPPQYDSKINLNSYLISKSLNEYFHSDLNISISIGQIFYLNLIKE